MGMPRLRHVPALMITATALLAACAQAPAKPEAPPQPVTSTGYGAADGEARPAPQQYAQPAPTATAPGLAGLDEPPAADLAGLEAQLDRAERALGLALGADRMTAPQAGQAPAPNAPPTGSPGGGTVLSDPCLVACAALASMRRSADHLCGMAGERDAACGGARERVQRAEQRVVQACPACASR